jgi:uncharacterized membrane protein (UPF0127 family)
MLKLMVLFIGFVFGITLFTLPYLNLISQEENKREVKINGQLIIAETASTPLTREKGLSGRKSLGFNEGMLFIFEEPEKYGFWMKGMKFPIDIIWIRQNTIIGIEENLQPPSVDDFSKLEVYYPPLAVDKVLELVAGRAKLMRAKIGDKVYIRPLFAPKRSNSNN